MPQLGERLHLRDGLAPLVAVERANVNAGDHGLLEALGALDHEHLAVALLVV